MVHAAIIPDGDIAHIDPLVAHLHVVVLEDQVQKPIHQGLGFGGGHVVDVADVLPDGIHRLPPSDRIGADDWVCGGEVLADVKWGAARGGVQGEIASLGGLVQLGLGAVHGEGFEEALVGGGEPVVKLVA